MEVEKISIQFMAFRIMHTLENDKLASFPMAKKCKELLLYKVLGNIALLFILLLQKWYEKCKIPYFHLVTICI